MISKIKTALTTDGLILPGTRILIAVSGGADSISLLHVLSKLASELDIQLCAAHLNHRIRGKDADKDEAFVEKFAKKLKIPFFKGRANVPAMAKRKKISLEMAAREARYSFLKKTARKIKANVILTAHTADDQAETVILKLARGAGSGGLAGIARFANLDGILLARPMLDITREEIISYLKKHHIQWQEDKSNSDTSFLRNRVRLEILPLLKKRLSPSIYKTLARTADILRQDDSFIGTLAESFLPYCLASVKSGNGIDVERIKSLPPAVRRRVIRIWLVSEGIDDKLAGYDAILRVESLASRAKGSGQVPLSGSKIARREYGSILITGKKETKTGRKRNGKTRIKKRGDTIIRQEGLKVSCRKGKGPIKDKTTGPGHLPARASISMKRTSGSPIFLRHWRKGDRMKPFGLKGSKKLHDIFVDAKVPARKRDSVPVFECRGEIVWIPGYRIASGWELKSSSDPSLVIRIEKTP